MPKNQELIVIGAGGHAKVVIATARAAGWHVSALYDDHPDLEGQSLLEVPIIGPIRHLDPSTPTPALIAIGNNRVRLLIAATYELKWTTLVHPRAWVDPTAQLAQGAVVLAGAIVQTHAIIGAHAIVNTAASVDHDCQLQDYTQLGPGAHLSGATVLETGAFLGTGACTIPKVTVGAWCTVGAGAVVTQDLPPNSTAVGVPARPISKLKQVST